MASSRKSTSSGFGNDAGIFVDFLLSIVAILIVSLSVARSGLISASQQVQSTSVLLQSTNITRDFILLSLQCGWDNIDAEGGCIDGSKAYFPSDGSERVRIELSADLRSGVVVLSAASERGAGFFAFGEPNLPDASFSAVEEVKARLDALISCFSVADPDRPGQAVCNASILDSATRYMRTRLGNEALVGPSQLGVIELVVIEGHSDGVEIDDSPLPDNRAKALLLGLLGKTWTSESAGNGLLDDFATDPELSTEPLMNHVALSQRFQHLCAGEQQNAVCDALFGYGTGLTRSDPARLFALSSFGRYSLRFGETLSESFELSGRAAFRELNAACENPASRSPLRAACDPRDRRAEIRILMSTVPEALLRLQAEARSGDKLCGYVDLFSASAVQALNRCDGETCFETIREIARKGHAPGSGLCAALE